MSVAVEDTCAGRGLAPTHEVGRPAESARGDRRARAEVEEGEPTRWGRQPAGASIRREIDLSLY